MWSPKGVLIMKGEQEQVNKAAEQLAKQFKEEVHEDFGKMAGGILKEGLIAKDALGLTDEMMEGIYGQAYRLYNTGKYQEATQLFRLLILVNPTEAKYSMGLAACFHMLKEYRNAVDAYTICSVIDPANPMPQYHASDCYIQMKDEFSAIVALELAVKRAGDQPQYQTLVDRAKMTIDNLKQKVKQQAQT